MCIRDRYQVIIGNDVAVFYNEFTAYAGIEGVSKDAVKAAAKTGQNPVQRVMGALGEIFAPLIPALICGGLILGFRNVIGEINFFAGGTQSLADISQFWAGLYDFLWLIGEAVFHMLPVGIVWSIDVYKRQAEGWYFEQRAEKATPVSRRYALEA